MDATALDLEARDRIVRTGLDDGLFVEAGAGTGKTTQLVGRVVSLVVDRGIPLREIAAITFTEAAASELRDRIREELERRAVNDDDAAVRERCFVALADADIAAIGTLHSFAQRLLGEHPVEVELPPRVEVLDEVRSQLEFEKRWSSFVDQLYDDPANRAILVRSTLLGVHIERTFGASLRDVAVVFGESWDRLERIAAEVDLVAAPVDRGAAIAAVRAVSELADQCPDPDDKLLIHLRNKAGEIAAVLGALDLGDDDDVLRVLSAKSDWSNRSLGKKASWADVDAARNVVTAADAACDAVIAQAMDAVLRVLASIVARFTIEAAEERRQEGTLEFHDLLVLARRLLRSSASARAALRQRYTRLLLDEFQDTDPIQIELAVLVASIAPAAGVVELEEVHEDWRDVQTEAERLFFVGDPKQSIYRFRRADIGLFLSARERFGADGGGVALTRNFRTVPAVLAWINAVFANVMQSTDEGTQPGYTALVAEREPGPVDQRVVLLGHPHERSEKLTAGQLREREAEVVAQAVATILRRPKEWLVHDRGTGEWREPRASEIAILVPTRTSLAVLQAALDQRAVPYRLETGSLVYETQEVRDLFAAIHAIVDPTNSIALVAALRSAVFGCADTELFEFYNARGHWDLRRSPPESLPPKHPVVAAMAFLRSIWEQRWWISPSELVERLIRERRLFELAFAHRRPRDVWRRLRFVLDQARLFCESQGGDLVEFLAWSELQRGDASRVHEPLLPETDDESVRIMTIHAAKGLEFPITVVSGTTTRQNGGRRGVSVYFTPDDQVELRLSGARETERFDQLNDLEAEMDGHEKQRLLYVATTRARDHLLVATHHITGVNSFATTMWTESQPYLGELCHQFVAPDDADVPLPVPPPSAGADLADTPEARTAWIAGRAGLLAAQRASRSVSATSIARAQPGAADPPLDLDAELAAQAAAAEATAGEESAVSELEADSGGADGAAAHRWRRGRGGTAFGRAVHEVLQSIDLTTGEGADALAVAQCALEGIPGQVAAVVAHVRSALASDIVQVAAQGSAWREAYVTTTVGDQVVEGYIDLLVRTPEGLVVVDYKTDGVGSAAEAAARVEHYRLQGATYALVLEASTGLPVVDVRFLFTGASGPAGGAIELPLTDLRGAIDQVRTQLTAAHS